MSTTLDTSGLSTLLQAPVISSTGKLFPVDIRYVGGQDVCMIPETAVINQGKIKLVMHLLSPGYKPVQVTSDLPSFWNNTYFEVKKELQRRYIKHSWPDDPWKAMPVAKGGIKR